MGNNKSKIIDTETKIIPSYPSETWGGKTKKRSLKFSGHNSNPTNQSGVIYKKNSQKKNRIIISYQENFYQNYFPTTCYKTFKGLIDSLKENNFPKHNIIFGIECSEKNSFNDSSMVKNLHCLDKNNIYEKIITIFSKVMVEFIDVAMEMYGFGDCRTEDHDTFLFETMDMTTNGLVTSYQKNIAEIKFGKRNSFAPLINRAIENKKLYGGNYLVIIIAPDLSGSAIYDSSESIMKAAENNIHIVCVGIGAGPWFNIGAMLKKIPEIYHQNFIFAEYPTLIKKYESEPAVLGYIFQRFIGHFIASK